MQNSGDLWWVGCLHHLPWHKEEGGARKQREERCKTASTRHKGRDGEWSGQCSLQIRVNLPQCLLHLAILLTLRPATRRATAIVWPMKARLWVMAAILISLIETNYRNNAAFCSMRWALYSKVVWVYLHLYRFSVAVNSPLRDQFGISLHLKDARWCIRVSLRRALRPLKLSAIKICFDNFDGAGRGGGLLSCYFSCFLLLYSALYSMCHYID
jgi:hypothetical protein